MPRPALVLSAPLLAVVLGWAGCDEPLAIPLRTVEAPASVPGTAFEAESTGNITGAVQWTGPIPRVESFSAPLSTGDEGKDRIFRDWTNPHAPVVDAAGGLAGAVVFLREVDRQRARPWDLPPVQVEVKGGQLHVRQGGDERRAGFLRPGDSVTMVSRDPWFEILQARGAAYYSIAFPETGQVRSRRVNTPGHIELVSGAGHFWMRGHLFVVQHPYCTTTDSQGRFTLLQVPAGSYQLVCWHPNWHTADYERDSGTLLYIYLAFQQPLEVAQPVKVEAGKTTGASFTVAASDFKQ